MNLGRYISICILLLLAINLVGQQSELARSCELVRTPMPSWAEKDYVSSMENPNKSLEDSIIIPVVVHNIHWNRRGYMEDSKIVDFIRRTNLALANEGAFHDPEGLDSRIRLCLAGMNPDGEVTTGIMHYQHPIEISLDDFFETDLLWDTKSYLNLFLTNGPRGSAQFPWNTTGFQGVILTTSFTHIQEGVAVMCHEVGHHLGLFHPYDATSFAGGPCLNRDCLMDNDMVCDTRPEQVGLNFCLATNSCVTDVQPDDPNSPFTEDGDDTMHNYMDSGACSTRFTPGQVERMHWAARTFLPNYIEVGRDLCSACSFVEVDFSFNAAFGLVGEALSITNNTTGEDLSYAWYLDGEFYSSERDVSPIWSSEGFHTLLLVVSDANCGIWSMEKRIQIRCAADPVSVFLPEVLLVDSCYQIRLEGVTDLSWEYGEQQGVNSPVEICIEEAGIKPLYTDYQQGDCSRKDTLDLFSYQPVDLLRRDYKHSVSSQGKNTKLPENVHIERLKFDEYLLANGEIDITVEDGRGGTLFIFDSFVKKWHPKYNHISALELFDRDSMVQIGSDTLYLRANIRIREVYEDDDGTLYCLSGINERWNFAHEEGFYISKINRFGRLEWNKWIKTKSVHISSVSGVNFDIQSRGENLLFYIDDYFVLMNKSGELIESYGLIREPVSMFPNGGSNQLTYRAHNEHVDFLFSRLREPIVTEPDTFGQEGRGFQERLLCTILNKDFKVLSSSLLIDIYELDFASISITALSDGAVLYFTSSTDSGDYTLDKLYTHYFIRLDNAGNIVWKRAYFDQSFERLSLTAAGTYVYTLANGDIIAISHYVNGRNTAYLRLDASGELLETRYYDNNHFENDTNFLTTKLNAATKVGTVAEDGFMFAAHYRDINRLNKLIYQHIPLDVRNSDCLTVDTMNIEEIPFEIQESLEVPSFRLDSIEVEIEDAPIFIRKSVMNTIDLCGSSVDLEDYSLMLKDSTCTAQGLSLQFEVCRQGFANIDTTSLSFFEGSPFDHTADLSQDIDIVFAQNKKCKNIAISLPKGQVYFAMVNARTDYPRPYTLATSFFDGAEQLEYNYDNNFVSLDACPLDVHTQDLKTERIKLELYPNPVKDQLTVSVSKQNKINEIIVYDMLGQKIMDRQVDLQKQYVLTTSQLNSGAYIIQAALDDGQFISSRFVIAK